MKKIGVFGSAAVFAFALLAGCSHPHPVYYAPPPPPPPALDLRSIHDQGFHDGFEAAKHDVEGNRPPDFHRHEHWRNPPVYPEGVGAYRDGFRQGYDQFLHAPQAPPPPGN